MKIKEFYRQITGKGKEYNSLNRHPYLYSTRKTAKELGVSAESAEKIRGACDKAFAFIDRLKPIIKEAENEFSQGQCWSGRDFYKTTTFAEEYLRSLPFTVSKLKGQLSERGVEESPVEAKVTKLIENRFSALSKDFNAIHASATTTLLYCLN